MPKAKKKKLIANKKAVSVMNQSYVAKFDKIDNFKFISDYVWSKNVPAESLKKSM